MARIATFQPALTGATLFSRIESDGQLWNGSAFENPLVANVANYSVALAEADVAGGGTGYFSGTFPAIPVGTYGVSVFRRVGGTAAFSDPVVAAGVVRWTGTALEPVQTGDAYAGTTTLLSRLTATRAGYLDNVATAPPTAAAIVSAMFAAQPAFRDVSAVTTPTVEDCLAACFVECAGAESLAGMTYTKRQPTGATFRTFTLDAATNPTSRT